MSSRRRVIVVGAGPGALAAVARLRERGGGQVDVSLIAPGPRATFLAGTLDVMVGAAVAGDFATTVDLADVECVGGTVTAVGPDGVTVGEDRLPADAVIAAPGLALGQAPEWSRAVAAWDPAGAARARATLPEVSAGRIVIAALGVPYRCPPAPFALAVRMSEQHFDARHMTRFVVATPEPMPLAAVGGEAPALVLDACAAAGVEIERGFSVDLEASEDGRMRSTDGRELRYDAAFLVPPHTRAQCLAGLPGEGPLVAVGDRCSVDGTSLYVVGDAAATGLPRAAGVARGTAIIAADAALEALDVAPAPPPPPIEASCFMAHHGGAVSRVRVTYSGGEGRVEVDPPSLDLAPAREGERRRFLTAAGGTPTPVATPPPAT